VIALDDRRPGPVAALDRIGEAILDAGVDLELRDPPRDESALDAGDERPHQTASPVVGSDEHVEEARPTLPPFGSGDRETDQR